MREPPQDDNWDQSLPANDRARYAVAWQEFRCCRDCAHWSVDDYDTVGACGLEKNAALLTPEDYTCVDFEAKAKQE